MPAMRRALLTIYQRRWPGTPALRQRMGQAGRARALTFGWDETMARMLGYYRALLAGASS